MKTEKVAKRCARTVVSKFASEHHNDTSGRSSPSGKSFHSRGPAAEEILSPNLVNVLYTVA